MNIDGAKGHAKNCRNMLKSIKYKIRHGENVDEKDVQYALREVNDAITELEE